MRPAVKMAAAMMPSAEMVAVTVTTSTMTTAMIATARPPRDHRRDHHHGRHRLSRCKVRHGQRRCEDNGGNSQSEF